MYQKVKELKLWLICLNTAFFLSAFLKCLSSSTFSQLYVCLCVSVGHLQGQDNSVRTGKPQQPYWSVVINGKD